MSKVKLGLLCYAIGGGLLWLLSYTVNHIHVPLQIDGGPDPFLVGLCAAGAFAVVLVPFLVGLRLLWISAEEYR